MTARSVGELQPVVNRPGMLSRNLIGSEHGVTSFYLVELVFDEGARIPLHTHPIEEVFVVEEGAPMEELLRQAQAHGSAPAYVATLLAACSTRVAGGAE